MKNSHNLTKMMIAALLLPACAQVNAKKEQGTSQLVDYLPEGYKCPPVIKPPKSSMDNRRVAKAQMFRGRSAPARAGGSYDGAVAAEAMPMAMVAPGFDPQQFNTEEYSAYTPNVFQNVTAAPLSTFGADVDTASYAIFRQKILNNRNGKNSSLKGLSLRSEEMINYFKYDYNDPKVGEPFGVTVEIAPTPWNDKTKLLQVGFQTKKLSAKEMPASNLVFLLDVSGSMYSEDKLPLLKNSLINMLPDMFLRDRISIVTYASSQYTVLDGASAKYCQSEIVGALQSLSAHGSTNGSGGIQMAYEVAKRNFIKGGNNRVIIGTDGDLNVGITSESELKKFIEDKRDEGIFLTVLGFGQGNIKDNKMETLADYGNGSYHYIDSILEARRVLVEERSQTLFVAAKDAKFQVEFNPGKIKGYRLIGYETRKLNAEDFADDTKDGGEIGAGHQVTMLYEIVEAGSDMAIPEVKTKYQQQRAIPSEEWLTVNVRYKEPAGGSSKLLSYPVGAGQLKQNLSANMSMAAAVAEVAMLLNDSPFKGNSSYDQILDLLKNADITKDAYRAEFKSLVEDLRKFDN